MNEMETIQITKNNLDELRFTADGLIPVIASGGVGALEHFQDVFVSTGADAALAASVFHYGELTVGQVKEFLKHKKVNVR